MCDKEILQSILLPMSSEWEVTKVKVDESTESIYVYVHYTSIDVLRNGIHYSIYDHRPLREWRHLDLWQYKTYICARIPRYIIDSKVVSLDVPWSDVHNRMTELLEKKR